MGSFNEVCALSGMNIGYGDKVRVLFVTQNPYVNADQRYAQRGCYHYDNWFVRTPPLAGVYDDYGRAKIKDSPMTELIAECFDRDVIEMPFGYNHCHHLPVVKGRGLDHYFEAALEGRLLVQDEYTRPRTKPPESFPTWQKVHEILKKADLPIQIEVDAGFNAQPVLPGIVSLIFNAYEGEDERLQEAKKVLDAHYDSKMVYTIPDREYEPCLMLVPKGAFDDPTLLTNVEELKYKMQRHPSHDQKYRQLPVLYIMVRDDVWRAYCTQKIKEPSWHSGEPFTIQRTMEKLKKASEQHGKLMKHADEDVRALIGDSIGFRDLMTTIPFQTMPSTHITASLDKTDFPRDILLLACAELSQVEYMMSRLHLSWHIPSLGGQEGEWDTRTKLLRKIAKLSEAQLKKEQQERDE